MGSVPYRTRRWLYSLELYEIVGILVSAIAVILFFAFASRLDDIIGIDGYHWRVVNDVVGMYQNLVTWLFTAILTILLVALAILRRQNHEVLQRLAFIVRVLIAFCVMMAIYKMVNFYISVFNPFDRDIALQHLDRVLFFGRLPSEWLEPMIWKPLSYLLSAAYLSWFVLTYATILLMMSHSRRATVEYVFTALFTFYIGYITYICVPAIGPVFTVHYAHSIGALTDLFANDQPLVARDCFPSLHTGISLVMLQYIWRFRRKWTWLYGPLVVLIIFSTLYLRFHYGIDVIAGASLACTTSLLSPMLVSNWEQKRQEVLQNDTQLLEQSTPVRL